MEYRMLLGLDPGGSTGWCIRNRDGEWRGGTLQDDQHHHRLWELLARALVYNIHDYESHPVIVCENFVYQRRELDRGVSLVQVSLEYIGVAKLFCQRYPGVSLYMAPVPNKNVWSDDNLRKLGLYDLGSKHTRDAIRHTLWYATSVLKETEYVKRGKKPS